MERQLEPRSHEDESRTEPGEDAKHHGIEDERRRRRVLPSPVYGVTRSLQNLEIGGEREELGWWPRRQEEEYDWPVWRRQEKELEWLECQFTKLWQDAKRDEHQADEPWNMKDKSWFGFSARQSHIAECDTYRNFSRGENYSAKIPEFHESSRFSYPFE